jgi:hypothetical protein
MTNIYINFVIFLKTWPGAIKHENLLTYEKILNCHGNVEMLTYNWLRMKISINPIIITQKSCVLQCNSKEYHTGNINGQNLERADTATHLGIKRDNKSKTGTKEVVMMYRSLFVCDI